MCFILKITFTSCKALHTRLLTILAGSMTIHCLMEIKLGRVGLCVTRHDEPDLPFYLLGYKCSWASLTCFGTCESGRIHEGSKPRLYKHIHDKLPLDILPFNMRSSNKYQWVVTEAISYSFTTGSVIDLWW